MADGASRFRERAERARLAGWYRDDDGTDVPDEPELLCGDENRQCASCGLESPTEFCQACQREDDTGRRW